MRSFPFALVLLVAGGGLAAQTPGDEAEAQLRRGVELRRAGRDAESLDAFERAYGLQRGPRTAAQWGLACQATGRWAQAETLLREALAAPDDPWVARNRDALVRARDVASRHLATVELLGGPVGAQVRVNGDAAGVLPLSTPLRTLSGTTLVEISAAGYEPLTLRFNTEPGEVLRERVQMVPRPPPAPVVVAPPPPVLAPPPVIAPPPVVVPVRPPDDTREPTRPGRAWAIAAWAGAGVFAALGVTALIVREDAIGGYNQSCDAGDARGDCGTMRDRGLVGAGAAAVALPVAALLTGAGALLWVSGRPVARSTALRCLPTVAGMQCGLRF
ncbi:MAG: tetratricopeptide repeat protein [Polyangiales bacterium]